MDPAADGWPILSTRKLPSARAAAHEASRWPWATRFPRNTLHVPMPPCAGPATGLQLLLRSSRPATDQLHEVALQARPAGVTCRAAHPQLSVRRGHRTDRTPSLLQAAQRRWGPSVQPVGAPGRHGWNDAMAKRMGTQPHGWTGRNADGRLHARDPNLTGHSCAHAGLGSCVPPPIALPSKAPPMGTGARRCTTIRYPSR